MTAGVAVIVLVAGAVTAAAAPEAGYLGVLVAPSYAIVTSTTQGRLSALAVRVGDEVRAGQVLARIEPDLAMTDVEGASAALAAARAELARATIEEGQAREEADRVTKLGDFVSGQERSRAIHEYRARRQTVAASRAGVAETRSKLRRMGLVAKDIDLRAPFAGVVARRYLEPGTVCSPATPVLLLFAAGVPRLRFAVPADVAARLSRGQRVTATIEGVPGGLPAEITRLAPDLDAAALLVFVEADVLASDAQLARARPGLVARVTLPPGPVEGRP